MCETCQKEFVHLHVHSEYSLLDGLSRINHLVARAKELNQPAIALTDHGTMYGTIPFYRAAKAAGIKPIIGVETYVAARTMQDRDSQLDRERFHLLLLAQNQTGYLNLLKIASASQLDGYYYKPRIDHDYLARHSEGIIATTGCLAAEIPRAINNGQIDKAHELMGYYLDVFGPDRFFIELQDHDIDELKTVNNELLNMAKKYNLRFLATNDVHYTTPEEAVPHDVLLCIQTSSTINMAKRMRMSDNGYYLKSHEEMAKLFGHIPGALENSLLIAEMCDVNLDPQGYHLPLFDVPEGYDAASYLRHLCEKGLVWRYGEDRAANDQVLRQRLNHELGIINTMGFDTYFLIVWDLCEFARQADIWWNVRGSGAGSVVAYSLGITGIDPLANGLIFERFLNPGRVSMPDIDLDYPDDRRHEMVEYTVRKYGQEKVAQIITFGTLGARAAIRDVGRAMDMPLSEVDEIAKMIPAIPGKPAKIDNVLDKEHEFYSADFAERHRSDSKARELIDTAASLEGVSRHASSHAAGVIISDKPLVEYVPLNRPTSGDVGLGGIQSVTQWPMEIVESMGLLKVDFLGLSTLTVMRKAAQLIEDRHDVKYTMENIPYDVGHVGPDPSKKPELLFDMLERGEVAGVFQVEGAGMRRLMMEMKPRRFDHIIAAISLYRPGPMENIPEYIRRMHAALFDNKDIVEYHTEDLKPILEDTYGILVYQEQIIRIASDLAGYAPGDADMIRKAVSKKKKDLIEKHRIQFTKGAMARGYSQAVCDAIWGDIEFFARYGFNKCLPGDTELLDAATGRLVRLDALYHGQAEIEQTVSCAVATLKLQVGEVTAVLDNGVKPVYRLTTSLGKQIEATDNHPFYTFAGWQELGELQVGEQIAVPRNLPVEGQATWPEYEVIALAHLLAEGNLCHPHSVYFYTQSDVSLNDYVQSAEKFTNTACTVSNHRDTYSVYARRIDREMPPGIVTWAKKLGIWGKNAREKEIPVDVFTLKNDQIALLLGRMWDGDGSIQSNPRHNVHAYYATASERMARQVQHLLLRLGIVSSLRAQSFKYRDGRIGYQVHVMGGEHMMRFAAVIGPYLLCPNQRALCTALQSTETMHKAARDVIPTAVKSIVRTQKQTHNITWPELREQTSVAQREFYPTGSSSKKGFRRETINRLAAHFDSPELRRYAESDIYWDEIVAIEYVGEKQTYDLTIADTHNFIANDILVHNSHAADYAVITCQTAFLKAHYPVEYMTALLSVERDNTEKVAKYLAEARRMDIAVDPPDIDNAVFDFSIEDKRGKPVIRYGMGAIKNVGAGPIELILEERVNGRFTDLQDLCDRVDMRRVGKRALESMIKVGVFDKWGTRPQFLDALDRIIGYSGKTHEAASAGQMSLFGGPMAAAVDVSVDLLHPVSAVDEVDHRELLDWEKELIGVYLSEHPLEQALAPILNSESNGFTTTAEIDTNSHDKAVKMAGMISYLRPHTTKKGDAMAFAALEDLHGRVDIIFFPRTWKQFRDQVQMDQILVINGKVQVRDDSITVIVDGVTKNVVIPQDADAADDDYDAGWMNGYGNGNGATAPSTNSVQAVTSPPSSQSAQIAEPAPVLAAAPPPPPNFEEEMVAAKPVAAVKTAPKPKPERTPPAPVSMPKPADKTRIVVVEIKPVGNWRDACRQALAKSTQFEGSDRLSVRLAGSGLAMEFPNQSTRLCPDLLESLRMVPGIARVYEG